MSLSTGTNSAVSITSGSPHVGTDDAVAPPATGTSCSTPSGKHGPAMSPFRQGGSCGQGRGADLGSTADNLSHYASAPGGTPHGMPSTGTASVICLLRQSDNAPSGRRAGGAYRRSVARCSMNRETSCGRRKPSGPSAVLGQQVSRTGTPLCVTSSRRFARLERPSVRTCLGEGSLVRQPSDGIQSERAEMTRTPRSRQLTVRLPRSPGSLLARQDRWRGPGRPES